MNILVISCSPWRDDNNIGNSYSNIFGNMDCNFASIYLKSGYPQNRISNRNFQITEKNLILNLINPKHKTGKEVIDINKAEELNHNEYVVYNKMRILRYQVFFWARDLIWKFGRWKSKELEDFIQSFNPDIIFIPFSDCLYLNDIALYIKNYMNKPLVSYAWDDVYSLRQFSLSPLYWINRLIQRKKLKEIAQSSSIIYTISEVQQKEYSRSFNKKCKILYKGHKFEEYTNLEKNSNKPIKLIFTGNITCGRWKTLSYIGKALQEINKDSIKAQLIIYTNTPMDKRIKKALDIGDSVLIKGAVPNSQISEIQKEADILVHVESFEIKESLKVRMSFSTKLVDYFDNARCIFAVGSKDVASISYLIKNDAAIIATKKSEIADQLRRIISSSSLIDEYSQKSWECGKLNHNIDKIQKGLYDDLIKLCQ